MDLERPADIVIVAAGVGPLGPAPAPGAEVVGVDAGVGRAWEEGWRVDVAVGDFDSLAPHHAAALDQRVGAVHRHPADKDATDLELAMELVAGTGRVEECEPLRVLVTGIDGGRPDHALGALLTAASPRFAGLQVEVRMAGGRALVVHDRLAGVLAPEAIVSVVPVHGSATVTLTGARWPLDHHELAAGTTQGVSNVAAGGPFELVVHAGTALCIVPTPEEPR